MQVDNQIADCIEGDIKVGNYRFKYELIPVPRLGFSMLISRNKNVKILGRRLHTKASEEYVAVVFTYGSKKVNWDIPIEYRRTGVFLGDKPDEDIVSYIDEIYEICNPNKWSDFKKESKKYWDSNNAAVTREFFDILVGDFSWKSVKHDLPQNPNWARRIQDIKECGFTIATNTSMQESGSNINSTHLLLLPIPQGGASGYETWSTELKERIIRVLGGIDAFEGKVVKKDSLLPDHKFPEIRWDGETRRNSLEDLTDEEIVHDFQLLNNQRNQQKREVCRQCYQSGSRGTYLGIDFFYAGDKNWQIDIPRRGKDAEAGCEGCAWYDMNKWREALNKSLKES